MKWDRNILQILERFGLQDAAIAVVRGGESQTWAMHGGGVSEDRDRRFYLASVSKAYTATAVALAVGEGLLDFDAPITALVPELDLRTESPPTLRDLLGMRTGLATQGATHFGFATNMPVEERLCRAVHARRAAPFRRRYCYHNIGPIAARVALERATSEQIEPFLRTRLFDRLGMAGTADLRSIEPAHMVAPQLQTGGRSIHVPLTIGENSLGAGGFFGSIADAVTWMQFHLDPGILISGDQAHWAMAEIISPQSLARPDIEPPPLGSPWLAYGMGWCLGHALGSRLIFHSGNIAGCGLMVVLLPDLQIGIACYLAGSAILARAIVWNLLRDMLGENAFLAAEEEAAITSLIAPADFVEAVDILSDGNRAVLIGEYLSEEAGRLIIEAQGSVLKASFADCPLHDGQLAFSDAYNARIRFASSAMLHGNGTDPGANMIFAADASGVVNGWLGDFRRIR